MVSSYKKYWPQALLTILAIFAATGYIAYTNEAHPPVATEDPIDFAGPGVGPADPWTSTTTPSDAITQRIYGRDIKLTGYESLNCLGTDASGMLGTGTCGSGGGSGSVGTSTTDVATQVTFFTTNGATPALIAGDSGMTYNSGADRLTVTYASSTGISSSYASSTVGFIGTLVLNTPLADASVSDTITVGASGSVNNSALSASVSLLGQTIAANELASADFGDFTCNGTTCTTDNGSIGVADLASVDFGDFTCNGSACALDTSYQPLDSDLTDLAGLTAATGDLIFGNGTGDWAKKAIGTGGQILAVSGGVPTWVASTTFSSGLTYVNGNVTADLGTSVDLTSEVTGDLPFSSLVQGAANTFVVNQTGGTADFAAVASSTIANGLYAGTAGQVLYRTSAGTWVGTASTTFSGGLTYSGGNVTADLGTSITVGELASADFGDWTCNGAACTVDANSIALTTDTTGNYVESITGTANQISVTNGSGAEDLDATLAFPSHVIFGAGGYESAIGSTTNGTSTNYTITGTASTSKLYADGLITCNSNNNLTWAAGVFGCEADDTSAGGANPFTWATNYGVVNAATSSNPIWAQLGVNASSTSHFDYATTSRLTVLDATANTVVKTALNVTANRVQIGPVKYPADYVTSCPTCMYLSIDKSATGDDATIVLRDQGAARAEIGMVGDNDLVFKTVSGNYLSESFSTRMKIEGTGAGEPGNVGIGLGETTEASDLLSVGTGNAFTVDYVGNVIASTSITINNPANGNAVFSVLGQQQSGGGSYMRFRDNVQGTYGYFGQNSVINGGTAYSQLDIQNPQSAGTICMSAGARASATAGVNCDLFFAAANNLLTFSNASTTNFTVGTFLTIPAAADPAVNVSGVLAINTTQASSSLRFHDGTGERVVNVTYDRSTGPVASSTLVYYGAYGTAGTTSLPYMNAEHKFTVLAMRCRTDANTAYVQISDGSNLGTIVPCSTSAVRTTIATNGSFNEGENFNINFGSRSSTGPNSITVTMVIRDDAD